MHTKITKEDKDAARDMFKRIEHLTGPIVLSEAGMAFAKHRLKAAGTKQACAQCCKENDDLFCFNCCNEEAWDGTYAALEKAAKIADADGAVETAAHIRAYAKSLGSTKEG